MRKVKVFKFIYGKTMNLDASPECDANVIVCGHDRFTLSRFKLQDGHDDSLPYSANLCVNGIEICHCLNDGWGGQTEMTPFDALTKAKFASLWNKISANYKCSSHGIEFPLTLDFIADTLAITHANNG